MAIRGIDPLTIVFSTDTTGHHEASIHRDFAHYPEINSSSPMAAEHYS
jgi:hypothetical protein